MIETVAEHCIHKDCKYRRKIAFTDACFYLYYTGNRRNSLISNCDKYASGKIEAIMTLDGVTYRDQDDDL